MNAARAAQARARRRDAQSEAEYRAQQSLFAAADAEADAADAEATAKEAAMQTAEAEFLPGQTDEEPSRALPQTLGPKLESGTELLRRAYDRPSRHPAITRAARHGPAPPTPKALKPRHSAAALVAKKNPLAAKILAKSEEKTPAGMKLAASMELYKNAQKRKSKERKAVASMVAKAKKGDKQALADVQALKAAGIAVKADRKAASKVAAMAYRATTAKVSRPRKKAEVACLEQAHPGRARAARQGGQSSGSRRPATRPSVRARAQVAKAKAGDKSGRRRSRPSCSPRTLAPRLPTVASRRSSRAPTGWSSRSRKGNKKALRQTRIIVAAAKHGNPNAKTARKKLATAAAYESTLDGDDRRPGPPSSSRAPSVEERKAKKAADQQRLASVEAKLATGTPVARRKPRPRPDAADRATRPRPPS